MNQNLYNQLLKLGEEHSHPEDPTHDFSHIQRVLKNAEVIAASEGGDLDILVPAALFHDVVNYPKIDPRSVHASDESATWTVALLKTFPDYPQEKCDAVYDAIAKCSFNKGIVPTLLESKILQDADGLEATGAISILKIRSVKRESLTHSTSALTSSMPGSSKSLIEFTPLLRGVSLKEGMISSLPF
jgi:uncharacterized protein